MDKKMNLTEGLQKEISRCRKVAGHYEDIGPAGVFGKLAIGSDIRMAKMAIASQDTVEMIRCLAILKEVK